MTKLIKDRFGNIVQLDGYKVVRKLGQGGFGVTFLATKDGNEYVIKQMDSSDARDEYGALVNIGKDCENHLSCPVELFKDTSGESYLITDYIPGNDLSNYQGKRLTGEFRHTMFKQLLKAVAFLHSKQIYHRDIKPQNIMYVKKENDFYIIDFGIACYRSKNGSKCKGCIGTYLFMSGEYELGCKRKKTSLMLMRNDLFALGVTFFLMIENRWPFKAYEGKAGGKFYDFKAPENFINSTDKEANIINDLLSGVPAKNIMNKYSL